METLTNNALLHTFEFRGFSLSNRIVMAPMTRSRALNNIPNDLMAEYYSQRASAGLIITEGTAPSPDGIGYARTPGIYTEEQVQAWKKITKAVHDRGGKIFLQLIHVGRISHHLNTAKGGKIVAPSAVAAKTSMWTDQEGMQPTPTPNALSTEEIKQTVKDFANAAKNAIRAGFDGVELHGANGYLLEQFLNPYVNIRNDDYGGSIKNRIRFVVEVTEAVVTAIGKDKVGVRISPYNTFNDQPLYSETASTYKALINELNELDIIYLHISREAALSQEEGPHLLDELKVLFDNVVILNGNYNYESAVDAIENKEADLVAFGKPFISNPDLPERFRLNAPLENPNFNSFYSAGAEGYIDYPKLN